jgi:16S rRNA (cytosine967-C5)-methyltransferase
MDDRGAIESIELSEHTMRVQRAFLERLGMTCVAPVVGDAASMEGHAEADAVLLDAPCSGLGIIGRHPEARWRKSPEDITRLSALQRSLMWAAARRAKKGGRLVYSVCSPEPREGVEVIDAFLQENPSFVRLPIPERYRSLVCGEDVLIPPGIEGRDGFYVATLERRE